MLWLMPLGVAAQEGGHAGYTLAEAQAHRGAWTLANWDDGGELTRYVFLNMTEFWPHSVIDRAGPVRGLPPTVRNDVANFITRTGSGELRLAEYVEQTTVDGMIVLHEGRVVFETYPRMRPQDKHVMMSVAKTFASLLVGVLEDRSLVEADRSVETYLPELAGSGWEGVAVLDVLDMASGVDCRETVEGAYDDPSTCHYQYEAALGWLPPTDDTAADVVAHLAGLQSGRAAGELFEYASVNTQVLAMLVERVTGRTLDDVIATEIWQRMGAESDAYLGSGPGGAPLINAGLSSTLRDLARFGLLFTPTGRIVTRPVVSDALLARIQRGGRPEIYSAGRRAAAAEADAAEPGAEAAEPAADTAGAGPDAAESGAGTADGNDERSVEGEAPRHNTYQWDYVMADGDFYKGGFGGQGLYVSPGRDLVIAFFGTPNADGSGHELPRIARQLATSGLFELID